MCSGVGLLDDMATLSVFNKTHTFKTSLQLKLWQRIKLFPLDILDTLCKI